MRIPHRQSKVFPNSLVLVNSQEFGSKVQINEVRKISKNLSFSKEIIVFLKILQVRILEEVKIIRNIGRLKKFNRIRGIKIKKNWGWGKKI